MPPVADGPPANRTETEFMATVRCDPQPKSVSDTALRRRVDGLQAENAHLRTENGRLRGENGRLRRLNDAYIARARATPLFGPYEMTAGTVVGPGRRHEAGRSGPDGG